MENETEIPDPETDTFAALHQNDLLKLFDELSFRQKWTRVISGLRQSRDSGEHKWARLQITRLAAPALAVIVPFLMLGLISLFSKFGPPPVASVEVKVIDAVPMEKLDELPEPDFQPPPPDPIDVVMNVAIDAPAMPSDVAAPPAEAASVAPAAFDSVAMVRSPVIMRGMLGSRNPGARGQALQAYGGSAETEATVIRALNWLQKHQRENGSWMGNAGGYEGTYSAQPEALTALALLTFLAHGETPASTEYGETIRRALEWLIAVQKPNGFFQPTGGDGGYTHPIVTYALCEAYAITRIPRVREAAEKALALALLGQSNVGGFRYNCTPHQDNFMCSLSSWVVQAMKAATIGGIGDAEKIHTAMQEAGNGFRKHLFVEQDGTFMYHMLPSYRGSFKPLTASAVLCLQVLGQMETPQGQRGLAWLDQNAQLDWKKPWGDSPIYYWYYTTQVMFHSGGERWKRWNQMLSKEVVENQIIEQGQGIDGKDIGFWKAPREGGYDGKNYVYNTTLCALMLQVYYRYLPTFKEIPKSEIIRELGSEADIQIEII